MECNCRGYDNRTNVRRHKVIRHYDVVGTYQKCGHCWRVEWLSLTDELEIELANANYECIKARVAAYG